MTAQQFARQFAEGFLWADADWLLEREGGFSYWQHRLEQRLTAEIVGDNVKWRVDTLVVDGVQDVNFARQICLGLNTQANGWSFVVHDESKSIHAICSLSAPWNWDRHLVLLSEAAKFSAWFCDLIAERLAEVVGGRAAFSHHPQQPGLREQPDGVYWYVQERRARPEFWLDPLPYRYPQIQEIADAFAEAMGAVADDVAVSDRTLQITTLTEDRTGPSHWVQAGFFDNALFGQCWASVVTIRGSFAADSALVANDLAWRMFGDPHCSLLGAWVEDEDGLQFAMSFTSSALRGMEQLNSFMGHTAQELWSVTSLLSNAIQTFFEADLKVQKRESGSEIIRLPEVQYILGAFRLGCLEAIEQAEPFDRGTRADRRLLWFDIASPLVTCGIFNPTGPTLTTLAICTLPDVDGFWIVEFMRHPLLPVYRIVSEVSNYADLPAVLEELFSDEEHMPSVPEVVDFSGCPDELLADVKRVLREAVLRNAAAQGVDLLAETALLIEADFNQWKRLELAASGSLASMDPIPGLEGTADENASYEAWLNTVSSSRNIFEFFAELPNAWDGAINFQRSAGDAWARMFDIGGFFITYTTIGLQE